MDRLIRRDELDFLLFDLLEVERLFAWPRFDGHDRPAVSAVLDAADQLAGATSSATTGRAISTSRVR